MAAYHGIGWLLEMPGDVLGSYLWSTPRSPDLDPNVAGRELVRRIGNAAITAHNATQVASDLAAMAADLAGIVGGRLVDRVFGGNTRRARAIRRPSIGYSTMRRR